MATRNTDTWNKIVIPERVKERAASNWTLDLDCWVSNYSIGSHGYAQIGWQENRKTHTVLAHRASWELTMGPVPLGHTLDHLCKTKRCVNPSHLRILPNFENARRTSGRDWEVGKCLNGHSNEFLVSDCRGKKFCIVCETTIWPSKRRLHGPMPEPFGRSAPNARNGTKTHCKRGHARIPENSYVKPNGVVSCVVCKKLLAKEWHANNRKK